VRPAKPASANAPPGIIDTLSAGFEHVNKLLWIIAIPVVIDLLLWLGPQLSAAPVVHQLVGQLTALYANGAGGVVDPGTVNQALQGFDESAATFNVLSLLVFSLAGVPGMAPPSQSGTFAWQIGALGPFLGIALGLELVGTLIGCLYLGAIAQQVRDGRVSLSALARRVWLYWLSVIGFVVLAIVAATLIAIPIALAVTMVRLISPEIGAALATLLTLGAQVAAILLVIYLFFLVDAIVVSQVGPIRAAVNSARVVANNFWSTVGFIVLLYVISAGLQLVWNQISKNPFGTAVAIVANAYVASGLAAASMQYYQTRVARLPATRGVVDQVRA
jgi:hypothetical protein